MIRRGRDSRHSLTKRVTQLGGIMMQHRWAFQYPNMRKLLMPEKRIATCGTAWCDGDNRPSGQASRQPGWLVLRIRRWRW